jgi:phosphatidylcholine synthase
VRNRAAAWGVHLYTATGALSGFFGTLAVFDSRYRDAFLWMIVATFVDATDGLLARAADVKRVLPRFDGARLDDIVDYLTFVFLPVLLLHHSGALPAGWSLVVCSLVLLSSAYGFSAGDAKTDDYFFTGFPSYWNIVALYLHAAALPPAVNATVLIVLSILVFVRIGYVYPSRTPTLKGLTIGVGAVWAVAMIAVALTLPNVPPLLLWGSLLYPIYYTVLSFVLQARRARRPAVP